jgi:hypothetical protein
MKTAVEPLRTAPVATVLAPHRRVASGLAPEGTLFCTRCGHSFQPATCHDDRTLLLAACCPRCDGQLTSTDDGALE